jgi:hypothetical protein
MLDQTTALIAASNGGNRDELIDLAATIGFGIVLSADQGGDVRPAGPITFFLLHHDDPPGRKRSVLHTLRVSRDDNLRFAPVIVAGRKLTLDTARRYAEEGFDDVISLPAPIEATRARLAEQLGQPRIYFETADYFGPDRRRYETRPRFSTKAYVLWHFQRDPQTGTRVRLARMAGPPNMPASPLPQTSIYANSGGWPPATAIARAPADTPDASASASSLPSRNKPAT